MAGVERLTGSPNIREHYTASASPTFVIGDLVQLNANGLLAIAGATSILGIAKTTDPSSTTEPVLVDVIYPDNSRFSMTYKAAGTAATLNGEGASIDFSTGAIIIDESTGTLDVVIQELDSRDPTNTTSGRLIVTFKPAALQSVTGF